MRKRLPTIIITKNEKITDIMNSNSAIIVEYITDAIDYAIIENKKEIDVFNVKFEIGLSTVKFKLSREKWPIVLNKMIDESVKVENYRLAAKVQKTLEKIKE